MKNLLTALAVSIIIIGIFYFIIKITDKKIEFIQQQNKKLELVCDSLKNQNIEIKNQIDSYSTKIDSMKKIDEKLSNDYIENQKEIKNIKNKYEKNNLIDNFKSADIIKYFTENL